MIYVKLYGRLGNNLFQLAAAATLANQYEDEFCPVIDKQVHDLYEFYSQFTGNVLRNIPYPVDIKNITYQTEYKEKNFGYSPLPYQPDILLNGYFQSPQYFNKNLILKTFRMSNANREELIKKYSFIEKCNTTAINVRRGDFLNILDKYPLCTMNYFKRAIKRLEKDTDIFIVCSDDIPWCKKNLSKIKTKEMIYIENEPIHIQFYIQTLCSHNIISNSTFSWWAAYLNEHQTKRVIRPQTWWYWYDKKELSDKDLIPQDWESAKNYLPIAYYLPYFGCLFNHRIRPYIKRIVLKSQLLKYMLTFILKRNI